MSSAPARELVRLTQKLACLLSCRQEEGDVIDDCAARPRHYRRRRAAKIIGARSPGALSLPRHILRQRRARAPAIILVSYYDFARSPEALLADENRRSLMLKTRKEQRRRRPFSADADDGHFAFSRTGYGTGDAGSARDID